jgi:P27 family predicted phage terminase small subunit
VGRRGPRPKPRALHEKAGTYRPDRHAGGLALGEGSIPKPPAVMGKAALVEWKRLAPMLARDGLMSDRFRDILAVYCETWAEYWDHKKAIAKTGPTIVAGNGTEIPNPRVAMKDKCQGHLLKYERELGMTPAAATGMGSICGDDDAETDPLDAMQQAERPSLKVSSAG